MRKLLTIAAVVLSICLASVAFADFETEGVIRIHDITVFEVDPVTVDPTLPGAYCVLWVHFAHWYGDEIQEYFIEVKAHGRPLIGALWTAKLTGRPVRVVLRYILSPLEAWIIEASLPGAL